MSFIFAFFAIIYTYSGDDRYLIRINKSMNIKLYYSFEAVFMLCLLFYTHKYTRAVYILHVYIKEMEENFLIYYFDGI